MTTAAQIRIAPKSDHAKAPPDELEHFSDLDDYKLADKTPDPKGWKVELPDNRKAGTVEDLIVDTANLSVRYLEVKVDRDLRKTDDEEWVLVPAERAQLDEDDKRVRIDSLPDTGLADHPRFARGVPNKAQEQQIQAYYGGSSLMGGIIRNEFPDSGEQPVI